MTVWRRDRDDRSGSDRSGSDRSDPAHAWSYIERMVWRSVLLALFLIGMICFIATGGRWVWAVPILGGIIPALLLLRQEADERHRTAMRIALGAERRHDGALPPLRTLGASPDPRPLDHDDPPPWSAREPRPLPRPPESDDPR